MRALAFCAMLGAAACSHDVALGTAGSGVQSFRVTLTDPMPDKLGSPGAPVSYRAMTFDLEALGTDGNVLAADYTVQVYLSFGGNKIGAITECGGSGEETTPLATLALHDGVVRGQTVQLVKAFGAATLWVEDPVSHAIGSSPVVYFPQPTIPDIQTPLGMQCYGNGCATDSDCCLGAVCTTRKCVLAPTASYCSPWDGRHVIVNTPTPMAQPQQPASQLMVTSVFGNAYVVSDTGAPYLPGVPQSGFNNIFVFSFSAPPPEVREGLLIASFSGNVARFNGFTEVNFPLQCWKTDDGGDSCGSPAAHAVYGTPAPPTTIGAAEHKSPTALMQLAGGLVRVSGKVCCIQDHASDTKCCPYVGSAPCMADDEWVKYDTFDIDVGDGVCDSFNSYAVVLAGKTLGPLDPIKLMGSSTRVSINGMLQNASGQNEACKGASDAAVKNATIVPCMTVQDCTDKAAQLLRDDPGSACGAALSKPSVQCIQGSCKRGLYNFWSIHPRSASDVTIEL